MARSADDTTRDTPRTWVLTDVHEDVLEVVLEFVRGIAHVNNGLSPTLMLDVSNDILVSRSVSYLHKKLCRCVAVPLKHIASRLPALHI